MNPCVTFGIIVVNGEPFIKYNLRSLYPFAHQIIVVEGACLAAKDIVAKDGHSSDGSLDILRSFKREEDIDGKILIVTAEDEGHPDGFWSEKDEMSQAYAKRATGNYLWQVDIDEFYRECDIKKILELLKAGVDMISFNTISFWGDINYEVSGFWLIIFPHNFDRLFAWNSGYEYITHRPPTVVDQNGVDVRDKRYITAEQMQSRGIFLYHYSLLFPKQVRDKILYYYNTKERYSRQYDKWVQDNYMSLKHPFRVHNAYGLTSWLKRYKGPHPHQIYNMMNDVITGKNKTMLRNNKDVEKLLANPFYFIMRLFFEKWAYFCGTTIIGRFMYKYGKNICARIRNGFILILER